MDRNGEVRTDGGFEEASVSREMHQGGVGGRATSTGMAANYYTLALLWKNEESSLQFEDCDCFCITF